MDKKTNETNGMMQETHGPLMNGRELHKALGFKSARAFARASQRGDLPVAVFDIPGRRGKFAMTEDVAGWLESLRTAAGAEEKADGVGQ